MDTVGDEPREISRAAGNFIEKGGDMHREGLNYR